MRVSKASGGRGCSPRQDPSLELATRRGAGTGFCRNSAIGSANRAVFRRSRGQRVELVCCGRSSGFGPVELAFLDHVHRLDASQDGTCAVERFEAQHRPHDPLDGPVVLLDEVVDVLRLAQPDVLTGVGRSPAPFGLTPLLRQNLLCTEYQGEQTGE